jgi:hypothetical protein
MVLVTNEQNPGPKIRFQTVLSLNDREVIAGRNHAAIKNNQIILSRAENNLLWLARTKGEARGERERRNQLTTSEG